MTIVDLDVTYAQKDRAKTLGARWDWHRRTWYIDTDLVNFENFLEWLPVSKVDFLRKKKFLSEKNIENLIHFTSVNNIDSIFRYGLRSRKFIEDSDFVHGHCPDGYRLDGVRDGICFSIAHPNNFLLQKYMDRYPGYDWVVMVFSSSLILDKKTLFFYTNAASSVFNGVNKMSMGDFCWLEKMFKETVSNKYGTFDRGDFLMDCDPTDAQAELICLESVEIK